MTKRGSLRIEIFPNLIKPLRAECAKRGIREREFVNMLIRENLSKGALEFVGMLQKETKPLHPEPVFVDKGALEILAPKRRTWHGGKPAFETKHPELAARILQMWGGGKRKGGMSRAEISAKLEREGIQVAAGLIGKITDREKKRLNMGGAKE